MQGICGPTFFKAWNGKKCLTITFGAMQTEYILYKLNKGQKGLVPFETKKLNYP